MTDVVRPKPWPISAYTLAACPSLQKFIDAGVLEVRK